MTSTLHHVEYSMREDKIRKIEKRQKALQAKPTQWLRAQLKVTGRHKKSDLVKQMLEKQFGVSSIQAYEIIMVFRATKRWI